MGQLIPFYVPEGFRHKIKWAPQEQSGRVIEFRRTEAKKQAG